VAIPVLGRITAGAPILADQNVEDFPRGALRISRERRTISALRVSGDSMIGAGILDGDLVVVKRQEDADQGDIVAALLPGPGEDEATVKRFHRQGGQILLLPEEPHHVADRVRGGIADPRTGGRGDAQALRSAGPERFAEWPGFRSKEGLSIQELAPAGPPPVAPRSP